MQHHALGAIQHPGTAVLPRLGLDVRQVPARLALDMGKRKLELALDQRRDQLAALRLARRMAEQPAAEHDRGEEWFEHEAAPERLHHDHHLDRTAAEPAQLLRERQSEQTEFGVLRPDRLAPAIGLGHVLLALLELVLIGDQPIDAVLEQPLVVAEIEIHAALGCCRS